MIRSWLFVALLPAPALGASGAPGGSYAMIVDVGSSSKVPFAGTTQVVTRTLLSVSLQPQGDGWVQRQTVCDVKVLSDSRSKVVLPSTFIASLRPQSYAVSLIPSEGGWEYRADPGPSIVGYNPALTGGQIPERGDGPGVLDPDGDGKPGVTVLLDIPVFGAVQMYVVQRGHSRYQGQYRAGVIEGAVEVVAVDQRTLGASFPPFAANPEVTRVPERSRFRMVPTPGAQGCKDLSAGWNGGFGWGGGL